MSLTVLTKFKVYNEVMTQEMVERHLDSEFLEDKQFYMKYGKPQQRTKWGIFQQFRADMNTYWAEAILGLAIALGMFAWVAMRYFGWLSWN